MKKLGWYAVSAVVATLILCGGLLLAANLYVQSRAVQQRIRQALGASLRMPVSLKKTTFTPWDGLRIDGITAQLCSGEIRQGKNDSDELNLLTAHSFRVQIALVPLLRRRLVIKDVLLDRPRVSWAQDADHRWRLPSEKLGGGHKQERDKTPPVDRPPPAEPEPREADASPADQAAARSPVPANHAAEEAPSKHEISTETQSPSVGKFRLRHGSLDFLNYRRGLLGRFEEVNVDGRLRNPEHATGNASFAKASLPRAGIKLARFYSGFSYDLNDGLTLSNATASFAGGWLNADCHLHSEDPGTPYDVQCQMQNVSLDQLIREAGGKFGLIDGRLQGRVDASGFSDDPSRNQATGEFQLVDTQVRNFAMLQAIGSALRIDDLQHLVFKTARLCYRVDGTTVQIQPLILVSNNLQITAQGSYRVPDDRLDLHARLLIDEAVSRQLPQVVEEQFKSCGSDNSGSRYIDFNVRGPISKPSSNLYQKMLPNTLNGLLDGLLHPRPKRTKEKPPRPEQESTPPVDVVDP